MWVVFIARRLFAYCNRLFICNNLIPFFTGAVLVWHRHLCLRYVWPLLKCFHYLKIQVFVGTTILILNNLLLRLHIFNIPHNTRRRSDILVFSSTFFFCVGTFIFILFIIYFQWCLYFSWLFMFLVVLQKYIVQFTRLYACGFSKNPLICIIYTGLALFEFVVFIFLWFFKHLNQVFYLFFRFNLSYGFDHSFTPLKLFVGNKGHTFFK